MAETNFSTIDIGKLSEPITALINRFSECIGVLYEPTKIRRLSKANIQTEREEALAKIDINKIYALGDIELKEIQKRAFTRLLTEETKKQINMEQILENSFKDIKEQAKPENISDEWLSNFFDKCKFVSDKQMQALWGKVLAGEANSPNSYSKRTINFLSEVEKEDAELFESLCSFSWFIGQNTLLIYDTKNKIYSVKGITFDTLKHLDALGLISFDNIAGYKRIGISNTVFVSYHTTGFFLHLPNGQNELSIGKVLFTNLGKELKKIINSIPYPEFVDFILAYWVNNQIIVSSSYPKFEVSQDTQHEFVDLSK